MREPPNVPDRTIIASIQASYGIGVVSLTFLPLGHDSSAWVYRAHAADGSTYFLKVRIGSIYKPGLVVPRYLHDRKAAHVIAPLPTTGGALWANLQDFAMILYPFIEGRTGMEVGLTEDQWVLFGAAVKQMHATPLPPELVRLVSPAPFAPKWGGAVRDWDATRQLDQRVATASFTGSLEREVAAFWRSRSPQIRLLVNRAEDLGRKLRETALPPVLCHADLHTGNVLIDTNGHLWIVDWDETVLSPKERDLMFVVGGISRELVGPREEELFFRGYGEAVINPFALSYHRHAWAVQDISDFGEQVFSRPDLGVVTRRAAAKLLMGLFRPGEIVDLAFDSDRSRVQVSPATAPSGPSCLPPHRAGSMRPRRRAEP
ncbi:MAG: aminoglycoside phosphotransferase family protein [Chloroflexota bacterium]|nr:aminoglycoside phosphotransferase family protein [Chloroflexota bacterium]